MAALFQPLKVGNMTLSHRVALAPLTRFRANDDHVHTAMATKYYEQRSTTAGTLLITEATYIAPQAGGMAHVPGIWSAEQVRAWKEIVDAVHAKGSFLYLQLWALGRAAPASGTAPYPVVSASNIGLTPGGGTRSEDVPRPLSQAEIKEYVGWYAEAARKFVEEAGGDGVEVHCANGYLIDQFTQTNSNVRTDMYGGAKEGRCRFGLEVVQAVVKAVGAEKVGVRMSPWSEFQGMKMSQTETRSTFSYFTQQLKAAHPTLAYLHLTTSRVGGGSDQVGGVDETLDFLYDIWSPSPILIAGTFTAEGAEEEAKKRSNVVVAYGRYFISNPDLPERIRNNIPFVPYNRKTFYSPGPIGYVDYLPAAPSGKL